MRYWGAYLWFALSTLALNRFQTPCFLTPVTLFARLFWCSGLGLMFGPGGDVTNYLQGDYLSVYVPTTPNPTGGYFVMLKKSDCIELKMSVDDALKYIVSMGVVVPGGPNNPTISQQT
jgi:hypothetical protein